MAEEAQDIPAPRPQSGWQTSNASQGSRGATGETVHLARDTIILREFPATLEARQAALRGGLQ